MKTIRRDQGRLHDNDFHRFLAPRTFHKETFSRPSGRACQVGSALRPGVSTARQLFDWVDFSLIFHSRLLLIVDVCSRWVQVAEQAWVWPFRKFSVMRQLLHRMDVSQLIKQCHLAFDLCASLGAYWGGGQVGLARSSFIVMMIQVLIYFGL